MLLLKLGSELQNLVKKFQSVLKIWTKCRLNFHEVERTQCHKFTSALHHVFDDVFYTLTHFRPMFHFYTPEYIRKTLVFTGQKWSTEVKNGLKNFIRTSFFNIFKDHFCSYLWFLENQISFIKFDKNCFCKGLTYDNFFVLVSRIKTCTIMVNNEIAAISHRSQFDCPWQSDTNIRYYRVYVCGCWNKSIWIGI